MKSTRERHDEAVSRLAEEYRARGFNVLVAPMGSDVPGFLGEYKPDLIAKGPMESVILEVKLGRDLAHGARFQPIAERVAAQPGWRFSLVVLGDDELGTSTPEKIPLTMEELSARIDRAKALTQQGSPDASFLLLWSSVEALLRKIAQQAHLPLDVAPASTLVRELYSAGELSREQFELAMNMLSLRNSLAHGFASSVTAAETDRLHALALDLLREARNLTS